MDLLCLVTTDGIMAKKVSSTKGGEYHSPCPGCGGRDRFIVWDKINRYYCRQCKKSGDAIQYLRDFHSLSFQQACFKLGAPAQRHYSKDSGKKTRVHFDPRVATPPQAQWVHNATRFVSYCHQELLNNSHALNLLFERGLNIKTIQNYKLGWNPKTLWLKRSDWGLIEIENKKLWLPKGLIIPSFKCDIDGLIKIKVRRSEWSENDSLPKYVEISGSMQTASVYGCVHNRAIIVMESEFDAILSQQFVGDRCCCMALGGATKRPDSYCNKLLKGAPLVLFAFDFDPAGASAYIWWKQTYPKLKIWIPPIGKSPGDAFKEGIDLKIWVEEGLKHFG